MQINREDEEVLDYLAVRRLINHDQLDGFNDTYPESGRICRNHLDRVYADFRARALNVIIKRVIVKDVGPDEHFSVIDPMTMEVVTADLGAHDHMTVGDLREVKKEELAAKVLDTYYNDEISA